MAVGRYAATSGVVAAVRPGMPVGFARIFSVCHGVANEVKEVKEVEEIKEVKEQNQHQRCGTFPVLYFLDLLHFLYVFSSSGERIPLPRP